MFAKVRIPFLGVTLVLVITAVFFAAFWWQRYEAENQEASQVVENANDALHRSASCIRDRDCVPAGCSRQVCTSKELAPSVVTTCEYRSDYDCLKRTSCGCVQGRCMWEENDAYSACLLEKRAKPQQ